MENIFSVLLRGLLYVDIGLVVVNILFLLYGKIRKADVSGFAVIWSVVVSLFNLFFTHTLGSDRVNVEVKNGLSPEVILFIFLSIFTLGGYAMTLGSADGLFITALGVHIANMNGKYKNDNGRTVVSHTGEVKFAAAMLIIIGVAIVVYALKRSLMKLEIDEADRMLGRGKSNTGEWQPGETIPIYDKILRYENISMIFSMLIIAVVLVLMLGFLFIVVQEILFVVPAGLTLLLVLGISAKSVYDKPKYLRDYQFEWRYGVIAGQEVKTERTTTRYQGETRTNIASHNMVTIEDGETLEVDNESYQKYSKGAEVFIIKINEHNTGTVVNDLQGQMSEYAGKCQLYG